jgi:RND family efflux transporter MFP subunit
MTMNHKKLAMAAAVICLLLGAWKLGAPSAAAKPAAKAPPLVTVVTVSPVTLPVKLLAQGHLLPVNQVEVRPQATGTVQQIHFKEGQDIKAGQPLFKLDASDAEAQLAKAMALDRQYRAQIDDAQRDVDRTRKLAAAKFYSSSAVDTSLSKLGALQAQQQSAAADIQNAKTALGRTRLLAPISGVAGTVSVHIGSLAQTGSTNAPLVTLMQIDPIAAEFTLPEQYLAEVLAARAASQVHVSLDLGGGKSADGTLVFVNNTVNIDTGTITVKAEFPNPAKTLWPGAFVRLVVDAGTRPNSIALPPQAVLEGPKGRFVYLVGTDGKVTPQPVTLVRLQDQLAVVEGLKGGEQLVAEGGQNLKANDLIKAVPSGTTAAAPAKAAPGAGQ